MSDARKFINTLLGRIRADHPELCCSGSWDGAEVRVELTGADGAGVTLRRFWGDLHRPGQVIR
jgi:hypothetical protein